MPSTFPRSESSRHSRDPVDNQFTSATSYLEDGPRSNLDSVRYAECIHYLQDVRFILINIYLYLLDRTRYYSVSQEFSFHFLASLVPPCNSSSVFFIFLCRHLNHVFFSPSHLLGDRFPTGSQQPEPQSWTLFSFWSGLLLDPFWEIGSDLIIHQFILNYELIIFSGYLQYARPQILAFMFRHGHFSEACSLFFPFSQQTTEGETSLSSVPWSDPLTTDYGTIDDLCDLCLGYGAMAVLENTIRAITQSPAYHETPVIQYMNTVLNRICNYCETHRHFNYLYNFLVPSMPIWILIVSSLVAINSYNGTLCQVLKDDHVASGLCCIQLFMNSMSQEEALRHLGHAKVYSHIMLMIFTTLMHYLEYM
jgi:hypothetical protein